MEALMRQTPSSDASLSVFCPGRPQLALDETKGRDAFFLSNALPVNAMHSGVFVERRIAVDTIGLMQQLDAISQG
jgi:hypothetical protein